MCAYGHYQRPEHLARAARRAERRRQLDELAHQVNLRLHFRTEDTAAGLRRASELLDSEHPAHQAAGRALYATAKREKRRAERAERLLAGEHPGDSDGRYRAACTHAQRWGLPMPSGRWAESLPGGIRRLRSLASAVIVDEL